MAPPMICVRQQIQKLGYTIKVDPQKTDLQKTDQPIQ